MRKYSTSPRYLAGLVLVTFANGVVAADGPPPATALKATAPFSNPNLSPSLLDFATGMPVANCMKSAFTPKLLRGPFAGQPLDTPKGLAAAIKSEKIDAKQRVKAVRFLGTVDCQEYKESTKILLEALQYDRVEQVRYEAAKALQNQMSRGCHEGAKEKEMRRKDFCPGCCSEEVTKVLAEVAQGMNEKTGCPVEPSERVREAAWEAACMCCGGDGSNFCQNNACQNNCSPNYGVPSELCPVPAVVPPAETDHGSGSGETPRKDNPDGNEEKKSDSQEKPIGEKTTANEKGQVQHVAYHEKELRCLQGYCVVAIHDKQLVKADPGISTVCHGVRYCFSNQTACDRFLADPDTYIPAFEGCDPVILKKTGEQRAGWYTTNVNSKTYWFVSKQNRDEFKQNVDLYCEPPVSIVPPLPSASIQRSTTRQPLFSSISTPKLNEHLHPNSK